ncbi:hypothetical protein PG996_012492 [Apiospora saccharicola]|uniref:N-acetyltransferase domain-containing protein n=1 Tax=Apiospora saccharicola TaxID=335842 RepID=A0ABR1U2R3_9PEZI
MPANPSSPRFYLEPLSEGKHSQGIYELWTKPGNLAGTMETAPDLEATRTIIRDRAYGAKPGVVNFAIMAGPESPLYGLMTAAAPGSSPPPPPTKLINEELSDAAKPAPKIIGFTGILRVAPEEAGWYVAGSCRGRGVATEAVAAMLGKYWEAQPATTEVIAYISEGNVVSERVAARAGFVRAMERTSTQGSVLPNGLVTECDHRVWVAKKPV